MIFLAMDGLAVLNVPPEPLHRTESEPAPKETSTSKQIINLSHQKLVSPQSCMLSLDVIYRFSSISRSTRVTFKFQKLASLLEIAQNIVIVHHFDQ